jgi:hypothetical protein
MIIKFQNHDFSSGRLLALRTVLASAFFVSMSDPSSPFMWKGALAGQGSVMVLRDVFIDSAESECSRQLFEWLQGGANQAVSRS